MARLLNRVKSGHAEGQEIVQDGHQVAVAVKDPGFWMAWATIFCRAGKIPDTSPGS